MFFLFVVVVVVVFFHWDPFASPSFPPFARAPGGRRQAELGRTEAPAECLHAVTRCPGDRAVQQQAVSPRAHVWHVCVACVCTWVRAACVWRVCAWVRERVLATGSFLTPPPYLSPPLPFCCRLAVTCRVVFPSPGAVVWLSRRVKVWAVHYCCLHPTTKRRMLGLDAQV